MPGGQAWPGGIVDFETHGVELQVPGFHPVNSQAGRLDEHDCGTGRIAQILQGKRLGSREQGLLANDNKVIGMPRVIRIFVRRALEVVWHEAFQLDIVRAVPRLIQSVIRKQFWFIPQHQQHAPTVRRFSGGIDLVRRGKMAVNFVVPVKLEFDCAQVAAAATHPVGSIPNFGHAVDNPDHASEGQPRPGNPQDFFQGFAPRKGKGAEY